MIFAETALKGAYLIDLEPNSDARGFFARTFCAKEFEDRALSPAVAPCNVSFSYRKGTLRGMNFQIPPASETKLVRCIAGAIYDIIIDLRSDSPTYLAHIAAELTAKNMRLSRTPGPALIQA